jgi:hypothetical protein
VATNSRARRTTGRGSGIGCKPRGEERITGCRFQPARSSSFTEREWVHTPPPFRTQHLFRSTYPLTIATTPDDDRKRYRQRWAVAQREIQLANIEELRRRGEHRRAEKLSSCLVNGRAAGDIDEARYYWAKKSCGSRNCVFCGRKVARRRVRSMLAKLLPFILA